MKMNYLKIFKKLFWLIRPVVILLPLLLLFWLVDKDLVREGKIQFSYDLKNESPVITPFFPANRLSEVKTDKQGDYWQTINEEPVYFESRLPQTFNQATVEVVFKNQDQPLIQLGVASQGEADWNYDFKPLENRLLNDLDWEKVESEKGTLWQKEKKFLSLEQFLSQADSLDNFAVYNFPLKKNFKLPSYQPKKELTELNLSLRGYHSFYTYLKNEPLNFEFTVQDANRSEGPDYLAIKVYNVAEQKIYEQKFEDDGLIKQTDPASVPRKIKLLVPNLPEGTYRVVLDCEDEIFIRKITTTQRYVTFIDRIYLGDRVEFDPEPALLPAVIYSTVPRLGFYTSHEEGLQDVGLNQSSLKIAETHKNYFYTPEKIPSYILLPKNDIKVFGRGLLAFSEATYFNPEIYELRDLTNFSGIDYLISGYKIPREDQASGWKTASVVFDLAKAKPDNRKLRFVISAPELGSGSGRPILIKSLKITYEKDPSTWPEIFNKFLTYLKDKF